MILTSLLFIFICYFNSMFESKYTIDNTKIEFRKDVVSSFPDSTLKKLPVIGASVQDPRIKIDLKLPNWDWDEIPRIYDNTKEKGKVEIEFDINENGEILNVIVLESTLSELATNKYKVAVLSTNFHKTDNGVAPPKTTGRITFIIQPK